MRRFSEFGRAVRNIQDSLRKLMGGAQRLRIITALSGLAAGFVICALFDLGIERWRKSKLAPLFEINHEATWENVVARLGEPTEHYTDYESLSAFCEGYNYFCREHDLIVPREVLGSWDRSNIYYSRGVEKLQPLPQISSSVALYRITVFHSALIYFGPEHRVDRIVLCNP